MAPNSSKYVAAAVVGEQYRYPIKDHYWGVSYYFLEITQL